MSGRELVAPANGAIVALLRMLRRAGCQIAAIAWCVLIHVSLPIGTGQVLAGEIKSLNERLTGSWSFVSSINTRKDGTSFERWPPNPKGMLIFDGRGHFSQMITSNDRLFGAKTVASFGKYSVDEANKVIVMEIQGSTTPKAAGTVQRRNIVLLTDDELKYINPVSSTGMRVEALWRRNK